MHDQAEDRCHRIGQHDAVTAWYLLAADTIDETMIELISRKRGIVGAVTDGRRDESEALVQAVVRELRAKPRRAAPAATLRRLVATAPGDAVTNASRRSPSATISFRIGERLQRLRSPRPPRRASSVARASAVDEHEPVAADGTPSRHDLQREHARAIVVGEQAVCRTRPGTRGGAVACSLIGETGRLGQGGLSSRALARRSSHLRWRGPAS